MFLPLAILLCHPLPAYGFIENITGQRQMPQYTGIVMQGNQLGVRDLPQAPERQQRCAIPVFNADLPPQCLLS